MIDKSRTIKLTNKGADAMMLVLNNPPEPNQKLKDLYQKYIKNVVTNSHIKNRKNDNHT